MEKSDSVVCVGVLVADVLAEGVNDGIFTRDMTRVKSVKLSTGGDAFNQAMNLSALGYKVRLCGKVGADGIGRYLLQEAQLRGIDTQYIKIDKDVPTSVTIVLINENGERNFIGNANGTNSRLTIDNIDCSCFGDAKIVSLGSLYGSLTLDGEMAKTILQKAKESSCTTIADMMHADRHSIDDAKKAFPYIDYFIPNYAEASELTKESDLKRICETLRGLGIKNVIIKNGKAGCYLSTKDGDKTISAFHVDDGKVIDTTGAGDAFVSGFITGLLDNLTMEECCIRGCASGAVTVQYIGATGGITSKQQIIDIVKTRIE
jgi:sugar/nucleoside kinase (ribokinase family)